MASGSADILIPTDTRILTGAAIHIGTGIMVMDRRSTSGRHFTGTVVIEFTTRGIIVTVTTGAGNRRRQKDFRGRRVKSPAGFYFFGDAEPAGADVDVVEGNGS